MQNAFLACHATLVWHWAKNMLQVEMKVCSHVSTNSGDLTNFQLNSTIPQPGPHSLHVPTLTICINAFKIRSEAYLKDVLQALRSSLSLHKAAQDYNIPYVTLWNHANGIHDCSTAHKQSSCSVMCSRMCWLSGASMYLLGQPRQMLYT